MQAIFEPVHPYLVIAIYALGGIIVQLTLQAFLKRTFLTKTNLANVIAVGFVVSLTYAAGYFRAPLWLLAAALALCAVFFMVLTLLVWRRTALRPSKQLLVLLQSYGHGGGDLTLHLDVSSRDEFGRIAELFNKFIDKIRFVIIQMKHTAGKTALAADRMNSSINVFAKNAESQAQMSEEVMAATEEVTAAAENVGHVIGEQQEHMRNVAGNLKQLSTYVDRIGRNVNDTTVVTEAIARDASSGAEMLETMADRIVRIGESSGQMTDIIKIINNISDRINLLALNASIEAARAGEAGRGFAVVADEISKLADQTATSIKGIDQLIRKTNAEIGSGREAADGVVAAIRSILTAVNNVNERLGSVAKDIPEQMRLNTAVNSSLEKLMDRSEQIQSISEEQKQSMAEVASAMSVMNELTQSNAQAAKEMFASSDEVQAMAEKMRHEIGFFTV
jgi:methyl-accepting chemotaxis protein